MKTLKWENTVGNTLQLITCAVAQSIEEVQQPQFLCWLVGIFFFFNYFVIKTLILLNFFSCASLWTNFVKPHYL